VAQQSGHRQLRLTLTENEAVGRKYMGRIMSRVKLIGIAAAVALIGLSSPGYALTFTYSFTNTTGVTPGFVPGTVTGEIFGLADNAISAATDVTITSYPANTTGFRFTFPTPPLDLFASPWTVNQDQFVVSGGEITGFAFVATGTDTNTAYIIPFFSYSSHFSFQLCSNSVACALPAYSYAGGVLTQSQTSLPFPDGAIAGQAYSPDVTFNLVTEDGPIPATPIPSVWFPMALVVGGFFGWCRIRRNPAKTGRAALAA
jgi:hypothetical protein